MPNTVVGTGDTVVNMYDTNLCFHGVSIIVGKTILPKIK